MQSQEGFLITKVINTEREIIFELDGEKNGCSKILFERGDRPDLKTILVGLFQGENLFDFEIIEGTQTKNGKCKIDTIIRYRPG